MHHKAAHWVILDWSKVRWNSNEKAHIRGMTYDANWGGATVLSIGW